MADQAKEGLLSPFLCRRRMAAAMPHLKGRILDVGCGSGALARFISPDNYLGFDPDKASIAAARRTYPDHRFVQDLDGIESGFDTAVTLAVIEHVDSPVEFLTSVRAKLKPEGGKIVCTTPHPSMDWIHTAGSSIGLFSGHASEEHEELLDQHDLDRAGREAGLTLLSYRRFLLGANQLAVFATTGVQS